MAQEYKYVFAATDYFFKWLEVTVSDFTMMIVAEFIRIYITYQFDVTESITVDNSQPFKSYKLYANKRRSLLMILRTSQRDSGGIQ